MTLDLIIKVFEVIDGDLLEMLGDKSFEEHIIERSLAFYNALNSLTKDNVYNEFMEK